MHPLEQGTNRLAGTRCESILRVWRVARAPDVPLGDLVRNKVRHAGGVLEIHLAGVFEFRVLAEERTGQQHGEEQAAHHLLHFIAIARSETGLKNGRDCAEGEPDT